MSDLDWSWVFHESRPVNDDTYFESMTRALFHAGLNWKVLQQKWHNIQQAFANFSIEEVAQFDEDQIGELIENEGIIRNERKIRATIHNAQEMMKIKTEFGSFQAFLDSLDKSNDYALVIKELAKRFKQIGPSSARIFLYVVGEKINYAAIEE